MRYDRLQTFNLKLSQFQQAFLPEDPYYCDMLLARPPNSKHGYRQDDCFSVETSQQLRNLLRSHFKTEGTMESIRQRLSRNPRFGVREAFNTLDQDRLGKVTQQQFKQLLQSRGQFIADKEASWLARVLGQSYD